MRGTWLAIAIVVIGLVLVALGVLGVAAPAPATGMDIPSAGNSPLIWAGIVVAVSGLGLFGVLRFWASLDRDDV